MAEYTGPATTNRAEVIANMNGHKVPDTYATGYDNPDKCGAAHASEIKDPYERYGNDTPEDTI
jgi:hypothetical protein